MPDMSSMPRLTTDRLLLRPFTDADAPAVQRLAGDRAIAATTLLIPHPYPDGVAEEWFAGHEPSWEQGTGLALAITQLETADVVGAVGLTISPEHRCGELGYWIGRPYWGRGYGTEAARATIAFGFESMNLNRIEAHHFHTNPASGKIMRKLGMTLEGTMRQKIRKWGEFLDTHHYAILRSEYDAATSP
jgi:ribosomal-protein-alanine N-acetyltransferase